MVEILATLQDTPLPSILVIGGLVFLLLPFIKKTGGAVEIETANKGLAGIIGAILLTAGIGLYLLPAPSTNPTSSSEMPEPVGATPRPIETQLSIAPTATSKPLSTQESGGIVPTTSASAPSYSDGIPEGPFREHKQTPIVGTGVLAQGTYSDGMAPFDDTEVLKHLNIQRIRPEENPDGCAIALFSADKIWFGSSVKTSLTINGVTVGTINGPTGKHGYIFDVHINAGDRICVTYFEPSGFHIIFGPDVYYHYDSYCYRGNCK